MVDYRRNKPHSADVVFFLTMVTFRRQHIFSSSEYRDVAKSEMKRISRDMNVLFKAWSILPDHIHWLIQPVNIDYSQIVSSFKRGFGFEMKKRGYWKTGDKIWLPRFWEHTIRDQNDYNNCVNYINFNAVKHGYVLYPNEWEHTSYHKYVESGIYEDGFKVGVIDDIAGAEFDWLVFEGRILICRVLLETAPGKGFPGYGRLHARRAIPGLRLRIHIWRGRSKQRPYVRASSSSVMQV